MKKSGTKTREKIFIFSYLYKIRNLFLFGWPDRFWLVNCKTFHKPPEFLAC